MASVSLVSRGDTDIQAALSTLQWNFELHDTVAQELLNTGVRNLEEFRFLFKDEVKIGAWVAKLSLGDATAIQTARLRRAWTACKVYFQSKTVPYSRWLAWTLCLRIPNCVMSRHSSGNTTG